MADNHYSDHASESLDTMNHEASVANAEQGYDMDEAVRHTLYIGWVLGIAKDKGVKGLRHAGGNRLEIDLVPGAVSGVVKHITLSLVIPMPPPDWQP